MDTLTTLARFLVEYSAHMNIALLLTMILLGALLTRRNTKDAEANNPTLDFFQSETETTSAQPITIPRLKLRANIYSAPVWSNNAFKPIDMLGYNARDEDRFTVLKWSSPLGKLVPYSIDGQFGCIALNLALLESYSEIRPTGRPCRACIKWIRRITIAKRKCLVTPTHNESERILLWYAGLRNSA